MMRSRCSRIALFGLGATLLAGASVNSTQANVLDDLRRSVSSLWDQKSAKQQAARNARNQATTTKHRQYYVHERLERTQQLLQNANDTYENYFGQLRRTEAKIVETRHRIQITTKRYQHHQKLFGARLAALQKYGEPNYLQVVLGSQSLSDLTRRATFFEKLSQRDARLQASLKADRLELQRAQNELTSQWGQRNRLARAASLERRRIVLAERAQRVAWRELNSSKQALLRYAAAQEESSKELSSMISQLDRRKAQIIADYEAQAAREREAARLEAQSNRRVHRSQTRYARAYVENDVPVRSRRGWTLPARGRFSSPFGMRFHPVLHRHKLHTGMDIAAPTGAPIRAANAGRVLWSGWKKAYGNTVIIDHGNGTTTLYGHASRLTVRAGQPVAAGQLIALVGSTGWSTGAHLHFEVRLNGRPVNPARYVRGR